jgi:hypothetical protein
MAVLELALSSRRSGAQSTKGQVVPARVPPLLGFVRAQYVPNDLNG